MLAAPPPVLCRAAHPMLVPCSSGSKHSSARPCAFRLFAMPCLPACLPACACWAPANQPAAWQSAAPALRAVPWRRLHAPRLAERRRDLGPAAAGVWRHPAAPQPPPARCWPPGASRSRQSAAGRRGGGEEGGVPVATPLCRLSLPVSYWGLREGATAACLQWPQNRGAPPALPRCHTQPSPATPRRSAQTGRGWRGSLACRWRGSQSPSCSPSAQSRPASRVQQVRSGSRVPRPYRSSSVRPSPILEKGVGCQAAPGAAEAAAALGGEGYAGGAGGCGKEEAGGLCRGSRREGGGSGGGLSAPVPARSLQVGAAVCGLSACCAVPRAFVGLRGLVRGPPKLRGSLFQARPCWLVRVLPQPARL